MSSNIPLCTLIELFFTVPRYNVSVLSVPPPVHGNTNILEFTVGSPVTLRCMVTPTPPSDSEFSWSCNGCFLESVHFQFTTIDNSKMLDSGEINCSVIVDHEKYTSEPIELGKCHEIVQLGMNYVPNIPPHLHSCPRIFPILTRYILQCL